MKKKDTELRLKYAADELYEPTVTPPHTEKAIQDCAHITEKGKQWAILDVVPTSSDPVVRLEVGDILSDGTKERTLYTQTYTIDRTGEVPLVYEQKHYHL